MVQSGKRGLGGNFQNWRGSLNLIGTAKVTTRITSGLNVCISLSLYFGKRGSSLLISLHCQWGVGPLEHSNQWYGWKEGGRWIFQIWYGWLNLTVTAKVTASIVGRAIGWYFYFFY